MKLTPTWMFPLVLPEVHGKYPEPVILTMKPGMIVTRWGAENDGSRMFTGRERR